MTDGARAELREEVRAHYAEAARAIMDPGPSVSASCCGTSAADPCCGTSAADSCCGTSATDSCCGAGPAAGSCSGTPAAGSCCGAGSADSCCGAGSAALDTASSFGSLYGEGEADGLPAEAVLASLGCGNPVAVADLHAGERVLDLGSGGGIDVLLSARRVGPTGFAYGVDMTDDMLTLARANAARAGATNVEFLKGDIEALPLPDAAVDVVISNCVINLSTDKPSVLAEIFRVLVPGGRIGISDVVAADHMTPADRAAAGSYVGCIAGALSRTEYLAGLTGAGFTEASVTFTHEAGEGMHSAIIRAIKPA